MGRGPCCEKMGLKKGPWTPEEDHILISHIQRYGHGNWRALPKQAGLLRCGKSCRLRWTNYLRPDIKRGNFSREEEDDIISLHQLLGNRWSAIAARLPGRTDNEIKNVWHTHLKKRLPNNQQPSSSSSETSSTSIATTTTNTDSTVVVIKEEEEENALTLMEDSFWTDMLMLQDDNNMDFLMDSSNYNFDYSNYSNNDDGMDFWIRALMEAGESPANF